MAIENEDWYYIGGAAAGGALLGLLGASLFSPAVVPEPIYTGLSRTYAPKDGKGGELDASVWALPDGRYTVRFEVATAPGVDPFPEMERPAFEWPFAAAVWADDLMWQLDKEPRGVWAPLVNQAAEARRKEKQPAGVAGKRRIS